MASGNARLLWIGSNALEMRPFLASAIRSTSAAGRNVSKRPSCLAMVPSGDRSFATTTSLPKIVAATKETSTLIAMDDTQRARPRTAVTSIATHSPSSTAAAYASLAKAKLSGLVVGTTAAGFVSASSAACSSSCAVVDPLSWTLAAAVTGTALCSASAAAANQILERHRDARMKRCQQRPLVNGTLTLSQATTACLLWGTSGLTILLVGTNPLTAALGAGNMALYAGLYTWLKPRSTINTWVGAVVGAVPPVMGWTAATTMMSPVDVTALLHMEPLLLGTTLYLWQMPHFFALSYMYRTDYARGGFAMVPCREENGERTASLIVRYAWYLSTVPLVATATQVTSSMFAVEGILLNAYALTVAHRFQRERTNANARKVFLTSLWYLPSFLVLFLLHSKSWDDNKDALNNDALVNFMQQHVQVVREAGRQACIHESMAAVTKDGENACPVVVGHAKTNETLQSAQDIVQTAASTSSEQS